MLPFRQDIMNLKHLGKTEEGVSWILIFLTS